MSSSGAMKAPAGGTNPKSILVVEDEVLIRADLADQLRDNGYIVIEAAGGAEALNVLHSEITLDLVITDRRMPGPIDGLELARQIRAEFPFLKVIMVSAEPPDPCDCIDAVFGKPCNPYALIEFLSTFQFTADRR